MDYSHNYSRAALSKSGVCDFSRSYSILGESGYPLIRTTLIKATPRLSASSDDTVKSSVGFHRHQHASAIEPKAVMSSIQPLTGVGEKPGAAGCLQDYYYSSHRPQCLGIYEGLISIRDRKVLPSVIVLWNGIRKIPKTIDGSAVITSKKEAPRARIQRQFPATVDSF